MAEADKWIMRGLDERDKNCIQSAGALKDYILQVGLLPLFRNDVPGFSVEEHVPSRFWWTDDAQRDPWCWRMELAETDELAYGKFFDGKAGFVSKELFPLFAAARRDGYDFDARVDEGRVKSEEKRIMSFFEDRRYCDTAYLRSISELKGKFEPALTRLMEQSYLLVSSFLQRLSKRGQPYGWHMSVYSTPETKWGYETVTAEYRHPQNEAEHMLLNKLRENFTSGDFTKIMHFHKGTSA